MQIFDEAPFWLDRSKEWKRQYRMKENDIVGGGREDDDIKTPATAMIEARDRWMAATKVSIPSRSKKNKSGSLNVDRNYKVIP